MLWVTEYETGEDGIDADHKKLFYEIRKLEAPCHSSEDSFKAIWAMFQSIEEHVVKHFSEEEMLQREVEYPYYELHKSLHAQFRDVFFALKHRLEREGPSLKFTLYAKETIINWMASHITNMDRAFGEFLKVRLVKQESRAVER